MTSYPARILGHEGQVIIQNLAIDKPLNVIRITLSQKIKSSLEDLDPMGFPYQDVLVYAYYERTDGGGTRIYRLKVNL